MTRKLRERQTIAERCLRALLGSDPRGQTILGDLLEEHRRRASTHSRRRADWWLLRQTIPIGVYLLRDYRRSRGRPRPATIASSRGDGLLQDLRYAARSLAKAKRTTAAIVATMALGIGGATAIFALVDGILLKPLPFTSPDRLVVANELAPGGIRTGVSGLNFQDWKMRLESVDDLACVEAASLTLTGVDGALRLLGRRVSWNFLHLLGVKPVLGRDFVPADDRPGADRVVLISHRFWTDQLGRRSDVVGQTLILDGVPAAVVGVLPPRFRFVRDDEVYVPIGATATGPSSRDRGDRGPLRAVGRLKPGTSADTARRELMDLAAALGHEYPATNSGFGVELEQLDRRLTGDVRLTLVALLSAAAFLGLLASVNVASLLLARGAGRRQEFLIRSALGASRGRMLRQLVIEHSLLCAAAGICGAIAGTVGVRALVHAAPANTPRIDEVSIDATVMLFAAGLSVVCGLVFGALPALQASRTSAGDLVRASRDGGGPPRLRRLLIGVEVALAVVLLSGAGLMTRTMTRLLSVDPGFEPQGVLTARLAIPQRGWSDDRVRLFDDALVSRVRALPGVIDAGLTVSTPIEGSQWGSVFLIDRRPVPPRAEFPSAAFNAVTPGYFSTLRLSVLRGRGFSDQDTAGSNQVAVINETLAKRYFASGADPLGVRIKQGWPEWPTPWRTIVGIARDIKLNGVESLTPDQVYFPQSQSVARAPALLVRSAGNPTILAKPTAAAIHELAPDVAVYDIRDIPAMMAEGLARQRVAAMVLGVFALLALTLAAIGLYGLIAQSVTDRMREIGVRIALGASSGQVLKSVLSPDLTATIAGAAVGLAGAMEVCRLIEGLLFQVTPADPATYASVVVTLLVTAGAACYRPARRALSIDPVAALRSE